MIGAIDILGGGSAWEESIEGCMSVIVCPLEVFVIFMRALPREAKEDDCSNEARDSLWRDVDRVRLGTENSPFSDIIRPTEAGLPSPLQERTVGVGLVVLLGLGRGIGGTLSA